MDINCTKCGEPWELDYFLHEAPDEFKMANASTILECPNCEGKERSTILADMCAEEKAHTLETCETAAALGDLLGDDVDGAAAMMEDFEACR